MRNHLLLFAACTALVGCSGPVDTQVRSFRGCTDDCAGYAAGYHWAEKKQITVSSECPLGRSDSFNEGCFAYTEDRSRRADQDADGKPIDTGSIPQPE
jgi:hypothetical protein